MKKIIITFILLLYISYVYAQDKVTTLRIGNTYNQKLLKGEINKYKIKLRKGEFCSMVVMQKGVDVAIDLSGPFLKKIYTFDTPNGKDGPELVEFPAVSEGLFHLEIYPLQDYAENQGDYEINSISVLSKDEYNKKLSEVKTRKQKFKEALNFDFEKTTPNEKLPDNWFQWGEGYNLKIDSIEKHSGKYAVLIEHEGERDEKYFGCVAQSIPSNYEGNEIELKAYMKLKNVADRPIGLMLRLDGTSGVLEFNNMQQKNIQGTTDWTLYSVKLPYPEDTKTIYIGALLSGTGQLWVDDFQLLIDGKDVGEVKYVEQIKYKGDTDREFDHGSKISSIDMTAINIDNLDILGKIWGFLKYYHPVIAKGEYNWDYELFRILPKVLESKNKAERNSILSAWIAGLGKEPNGRLKEGISGDVKLKPDLDWINDSIFGKELTTQLINIKDAERTDTNYYIGLFPGIRNPKFKNENPYSTMNFPDAGFRLLSLYRYWNIIQYYFPYKHLIEENWNEVLKEFIPKFMNALNELEYKQTVLSLIARIHDTHANIWGRDTTLENYRGRNYAPVKITFVENKAVVTEYYDKDLGEKSGLKIGDIIEAINNKSVDEIIQEKLPFTPASNYPTQLRDIADDLLRTKDSLLTINYKRGTSTFTSQTECFSLSKNILYDYFQKKDTCFKLINSEISYLYPGSIKNEYLSKIMPEILKTKGLIIDLRCYPSEFIVFSLSKYLQPDSKSFVKFSIGNIISPGLFTITDELKVGNENKDFYKGKVAIIVNEVTQSQAEYTTMAFRTAPKATVIGSTTAGADGNVSHFTLPGGIKTMFSGIGVYYPDGKETQRIGIVPDIEVKPTIKGISEGRDELLERAIEIINE